MLNQHHLEDIMAIVKSQEDFVAEVYKRMEHRLHIVRTRTKKPLTLSDKIILGHLDDPSNAALSRNSYIMLRPDRVAHQDVTGQMAILQFMQSGRSRVAVPTTVHCDHLIKANTGSNPDLKKALLDNNEVYQFLQSASAKYGIGFWKPGAGIIHQVVLENYAFPGGLMIGTDSHTPNASGLGMIAIGVGGADGADVMSGLPWELRSPEYIGVKLTGTLNGWTAPKDVILALAGILTVSGGTNSIIEYFGPGARSISCTGKATICNMGAELGATGSIFPYDNHMAKYLESTGRGNLIELAEKHKTMLEADPDVEDNPHSHFDRVVEINLSELEPHVVGPHTPDLARPISKLAAEIGEKGYVNRISAALIGSCTNSSYEDMSRAADIANQAATQGIKPKTKLMVTPGSEQIRATIERDGQMSTLQSMGATVLANACGPCIGQWNRISKEGSKPNTIITSYNRNFPRRNDGDPNTANFIASPEIVTALSIAGNLSFNPLTDTLKGPNGSEYKFLSPKPAPEVPEKGFERGLDVYLAPRENGDDIEILIDPNSDRLQILEPFAPWDGTDFSEMAILLKAVGKCTTDHISPAGPWLKYRGHLDNLSDNLLLGATNAFTGTTGKVNNVITGDVGLEPAKIARYYKKQNIDWVIFGDYNYGEGSSREHAALEPRFLGAKAVIVRSFARIHETNLKKQGMLALTFSDPNDYEKVQETDRVTIIGLQNLSPEKPLKALLLHDDGSSDTIVLNHTFNANQIDWFKAGSALNLVKSQQNLC